MAQPPERQPNPAPAGNPLFESDPPDPTGESSSGLSAQKAAQKDQDSKIYGRAGVVTFFTLLSRILGLARDLVIAYKFGASWQSDAWVQAFRIPNALRRLTAEGSMVIAFVPVYVEVRQKEGRAAAFLFARRVMGVVLAVTLAFTVVGMVFSDGLTLVFSPGFAANPEQFGLTSSLIRWSFPYLVMVSYVAWAMGLLNSEHRFAAPAAAPIFLNLGIIVAVVWFGWAFDQPILAVSVGVLAGGLVQMALQVPSLRATGIGMLPAWSGWGHPHLKKLWALLIPSLFGVAVYQLNIITLGIIASYLPTGQIFHYNNATRLTELVLGLFAFSFTTAGLPTMSEHHAREDWAAMSRTIRFTFSAVMYMILPAMVGLMVIATPIVSMLYFHGAFHYPDVVSTARTLVFMAIGMPAVGMVRVLTPAFYTLGDSRSPVLISFATLFVTGALGWGLSIPMAVSGLALGLSLGVWFQVALLGWVLHTRAHHLTHWFPWDAVGRQTLGALAMGAYAFALGYLGRWEVGSRAWGNWALLLVAVGGATVVYLSVTLALKEPEAEHWVQLVKRGWGKARRLAHLG